MRGKRAETHDLKHRGYSALVGMFERGKGTSKHADKRANEGKPAADKIYVDSTLNDYTRKWGYFCDRAKEDGVKLRTMDDAKEYLSQYIEELKDEGKSAWTIRSYFSAVAKVVQVDAADYDLPERRSEDITRSRGEKVRDSHFSEERHQDLIEYLCAVGPRSHKELSVIRGTDLFQREDGTWMLHIDEGKGGRPRDVRVYGTEEQIQAVVDRHLAAGDGLVWDKIPNAADVHGYRGEFAERVYETYARPIDELREIDKHRDPHDQLEVYYCRGARKGECFDKQALSRVAIELGHSGNRYSTVVNNYLYRKG